FLAAGEGYAEPSYREVARQLDQRRAAWEAMRRESCEATLVRREQSDSMMDRRAACLDGRLHDVGAFVAELRRGGAETVRRAATGVARRGAPSPAGGPAAPARRVPPPPDPAARRAVEALERDLSAARAGVAAGRLREMGPETDRLVARAREVGY